MSPDVKIVPLIDLDVEINSYAADFYLHGIVKAIVVDNGLKHGQEFASLQDFLMVLKTIIVAFDELDAKDANDPLLFHFRAILERFRTNFAKAFL